MTRQIIDLDTGDAVGSPQKAVNLIDLDTGDRIDIDSAVEYASRVLLQPASAQVSPEKQSFLKKLRSKARRRNRKEKSLPSIGEFDHHCLEQLESCCTKSSEDDSSSS